MVVCGCSIGGCVLAGTTHVELSPECAERLRLHLFDQPLQKQKFK